MKSIKLGPVLSGVFGSLFYPQVVLLMFLPFFISLFLVVLGLWFSRDFWMSYFVSGPLAFQPYWIWIFERTPIWLQPVLNFLSSVAPWMLFIVLFALSFPLVIAINLILVSVLASTYLVKFLARRDYKDLEFKGKPRFVGGLVNSLAASALYLFVWFVTLPLWLIPGVAFVLPMLLTAWLNRRICTFDALTDFATDEELKNVTDETSGKGFVLGLLTAVLNYIPFAFFIAPVLTMVGYIHLNLQALSLKRKGLT